MDNLSIERYTLEMYRNLWREDGHGMRDLKQGLDLMTARRRTGALPFLVVVWPWLGALDDYPFHTIHERIDALCRERGLAALQLLDRFKDLDGSVPVRVHESDNHPSAALHRLAADVIVERLLSDPSFGLVPAGNR